MYSKYCDIFLSSFLMAEQLFPSY